MLLLWILYVICVSCLSFLNCLVFFLQPCDHQLEKGWPLGPLVCDVFLCFCLFFKWWHGSGMVLKFINSWYLPSSLRCLLLKKQLYVAFPWIVTSTGPGGLLVCCVIYDGCTRRLNRKWFHGEAGNRTCLFFEILY